MELEDCVPGNKVYIGGKYLLTQLNSVAEILEVLPAPEQSEVSPDYPYGMVQLKLADHVNWSYREPWFGPEDLAPYPLLGERAGD